MLHRYLHRSRALRFLGPKRLFGFAQRLESFRSLNSRERPLFFQERTIESLVWATEAGRLLPMANWHKPAIKGHPPTNNECPK